MEATAEPIPKRSDVQKIARNVALKHLTHEGIMLEKIMRQNRMAEKIADVAATGKADSIVPEEDMGVAIGNEYHEHNENHYHVAPEATSVTTTPATTEKPSLARKVALPLLCGALGIGGPIAGFVLSQWWDKPESSTTVIQQPSEQDWKLGVQVSDRP